MALKQLIKKEVEPKNDRDFMMLYLEEKFIRVHERLDNIDEKTDGIDTSVKELAHTVDSMKLVEDRHFLTCPNTDDLKEIKAEISENKFFKKYWKPFAIAAVVSFLITFVGVLKLWEEYKVLIVEKAILRTEVNKNTQGKIENKTSIDSIKK